MKNILIKTATMGILILHGCGSSSDGGDSKSGQSVNTILSKAEAAQRTPSSMDNAFKANNTFVSAKMMQKVNAKSDGTFNCSPERTDETDNGKKTIETLEDGTVKVTYNECFENDTMSDGVLEYFENDEGTTLLRYTEYIYVYYNEKNNIKIDFYKKLQVAFNGSSYLLNGDISVADYDAHNDKLTISEEYDYENLLYLERDKYTINITGTESMKIGSCSTAVNFNYKMVEGTWLNLNQTDDNLIDSGEIIINEKKYIYQGKDVYVSYNGKSGTFDQKELLAEEENKKYAESCSRENRNVSSKMFNTQFNYKLNIEKL